MSYLPFRQIHLDFHTSPAVPDVGEMFDAEIFAERLAEARVNSVTLFAKCHHGHLYYRTAHPARHPRLKKDLNLLGEQIEACRRRNIRTPIYLSVQCDEFAAAIHPEWRVILPDNTLAGAQLQAGWHIVDMSSPYQDYLAEQLAEVLKLFSPVDGIFLDMCWDQESLSNWALAGMKKANLNPENEIDRRNYAHKISMSYMTRYKNMVDEASNNTATSVAFNSRPLWNLSEESKFLRHVEIEALPTGGWGYMYFPLNVRFARTFGLPTLGMTGRFHKSWGDFGGFKPQAALMYECCQMLAHGARCSIGDQLHPRGELDEGAYELIGAVYRHIEACEAWCENAVPVTDVAVLRASENNYHAEPGSANEGVVRALTQLGHQFDFISIDANFDSYKTIIVPETIPVTNELAVRLNSFAAKGGGVLLSGAANLNVDGTLAMSDIQGVEYEGDSLFTCTYLRFEGEFAEGIAANSDHVMYERGIRLKPKNNAKGFVRIVEPYFERTWEHFCSHSHAPADKLSSYFGVICKGRIASCAFPIFKAYATHGNIACRHMIDKIMNIIHPDPLIRIKAPSFVETTVTCQRNRHIVHLLAYAPIRRTQTIDIIEDASIVKDAAISLCLHEIPALITLQPQGFSIPFEINNGRVEFKVAEFAGHVMLVIE